MDAYGVMWHGHYLRYLEIARDEAALAAGVPLQIPNEGYVYPIAEQHLRFKQPARLRDTLEMHTHAVLKGPRLVFSQSLYRVNTTEPPVLLLEAETHCVVCETTANGSFKPVRRFEPHFIEALARLAPNEAAQGH
jgi:YbgC/YbaW family acyl-CoA thioester hydrolase